MPSNFQDVLLGLDQLFFKDIIPPETTQDRADAIEAFLTAKEWSWEDILVEIGKSDASKEGMQNLQDTKEPQRL